MQKSKNLATLYVDLDGTLICSDLLHEAVFLALRQDPLVLLRLPFWLLRGKAVLKMKLASRVTPEPQLLPYNNELLAFLRSEQALGRTLVLISASPRAWAEAVARHLSLFDNVIATENDHNLKGRKKLAAILSHETGPTGFAYVGDSWADMHIWREATQIYAVGPNDSMKRRLQNLEKEVVIFDKQRSLIKPAIEAIRPYHYITYEKACCQGKFQ